MYRALNVMDSQQALSFLIQQATIIEPQVYEIQYPEIQYPNLVPVDTSGNEWAKTVTFFSMDKVGQANWFSGAANDMPRADVNRDKFEHGLHMAGIGYGYDLEELGQAMMIPGTNLTTERADAARFAYERFMDDLTLRGSEIKNMSGLIDYPGITAVTAQADGTGGSSDWSTKTGDQILRDVNAILSGVWTGSNTVEMADTLLLPLDSYTLVATRRLGDTTMTVLDFLMEKNVYTAQTGRPLTIRAVRGLDTAGAGGTGRMVAYRRDPRVLKLHLPMPHRFLPVWQTGPIRFDVPGIFRTGGLEIRLPGAVRYLDGIIVPGTE